MKTKQGFTLVEMLIVMVILGIIIPLAYRGVIGMVDKTKEYTTKMEMQQIQRVIYQAQTNTDLPLRAITNNNCTMCRCGYLRDSNNVIVHSGGSAVWKDPSEIANPVCLEYIKSSMDKITQAASNESKAPAFYTDSWGRPYLLDENEGEPGRSNPCSHYDVLSSVGADSRRKTSDDLRVELVPLNCRGSF